MTDNNHCDLHVKVGKDAEGEVGLTLTMVLNDGRTAHAGLKGEMLHRFSKTVNAALMFHLAQVNEDDNLAKLAALLIEEAGHIEEIH